MRQLTEQDIYEAKSITVLFDNMYVELPGERMPYCIERGDGLWIQVDRIWDDTEYEDFASLSRHPEPDEAIEILIKWGCMDKS